MEIKFRLIVSGLQQICRFQQIKIENCPYMREGDESILGTIGLTKLLKIDIFTSLCDI